MSYRHHKYKRGTPIEINNRFKDGSTEKCIGYYWMNDATNQRIVLISTLPPLKLNGRYLEKRYCDYTVIQDIKKLENSRRGQR